jgi:hypothetical protein
MNEKIIAFTPRGCSYRIRFNYSITREGVITNLKTGRTLRPFMSGMRKGSYPTVDLYKGGRRYREYVHRLVALHFIPNPENKPEVNHFDLDHMNYSADNLEWVTRSENEMHKRFMKGGERVFKRE